MTAKPRLEVDRAELARLVGAAESSDEVLGSVQVPLNGASLGPIIAAAKAARPVFAPPVATFVDSRTRERDLGNGPLLNVEADPAPALTERSKLHLLHQRHGAARAPARSSEEGPSRFHMDHRCGSPRP